MSWSFSCWSLFCRILVFLKLLCTFVCLYMQIFTLEHFYLHLHNFGCLFMHWFIMQLYLSHISLGLINLQLHLNLQYPLQKYFHRSAPSLIFFPAKWQFLFKSSVLSFLSKQGIYKCMYSWAFLSFVFHSWKSFIIYFIDCIVLNIAL